MGPVWKGSDLARYDDTATGVQRLLQACIGLGRLWLGHQDVETNRACAGAGEVSGQPAQQLTRPRPAAIFSQAVLVYQDQNHCRTMRRVWRQPKERVRETCL